MTNFSIPIRTKFIVFFIILFLIMISFSLFVIYNNNQTIQQYTTIQERFFMLNDVSQKSAKTYEAMETFLIRQLPADLDQYQASRQDLINAKRLLETNFQNEINFIDTKNFQNIIDSFIEESDAAVNSFLEDDIEAYSSNQKEAYMLIGFIQDQTLTLLNEDLSMFQTYYDAINTRNDYMQVTLVFMTIAALSFGLLITYLFSHNITRPIYQLTRASREVARGKLDGPTLPESNDEIGFLSKTFNKMRTDLEHNVRQLKEQSEQEKLLKEMELKSLQSQINPHFLFNTLNTISKYALINGSEQIYRLINSISKLLRYNLGAMDKPVTLSDEISVVQEYFYIQKTRFQDRVDFIVNVSDECLSLKLPILTLQPLVENAFIHGIEPYEQKGVIEIEGYSQGESIILKIRDNGIGMDRDTIHMLLDKSTTTSRSTGHSTGLGVKNVFRRLELFYQSKERISIESEIGTGTIIELILPKNFTSEG
ncbi:Histidine kinase-, DNA gyrase B-, and HSP90-like ATPase [Mesobacillus persicus]|uniref:histidine kinase n=1 Tax=Mesobacillus persicus TaxID=930146 RepID=A0A1H8FXW4_9BACI|nr:sensor histidine kinase [Mesobacillus persicus]SEN36542.1 Histidine kinase-, DNA gyrase B-, and HSP90-like ATPase [Mesobacillus persicus]